MVGAIKRSKRSRNSWNRMKTIEVEVLTKREKERSWVRAIRLFIAQQLLHPRLKEENVVAEYGEGEDTHFHSSLNTFATCLITVRYFIVAILANFVIDRVLKPENNRVINSHDHVFRITGRCAFPRRRVTQNFSTFKSFSGARVFVKLAKSSQDQALSKNLFESIVRITFQRISRRISFSIFFFSRQRSRQKFVENSFERKYASWVLSVATYPPRERNKCVSRRFSFDILSRSSSSLFLPLYLCAFSLTMDQRAVLRAHTCAVLKERWRTSFLACITVCIGFVDSQYVQVACSGTGECQCRARVARHEKREHI